MRKTFVIVFLLLGFLPLPFCSSMANAMEPHEMAGEVMIHATAYDIMLCCIDAHEQESGHSVLNELLFQLPSIDTCGTTSYQQSNIPLRDKRLGVLLHTDRGKFEEQGGIKRE